MLSTLKKSLALILFVNGLGALGQAYAQSPSKPVVEETLAASYQSAAQGALRILFRGTSESWGVTTSVQIDSGQAIMPLEEEDYGYPGSGISRSEREAIFNRLGDYRSLKQAVKFIVVMPKGVGKSYQKAAQDSILNAAGIAEPAKAEFVFHTSYQQAESMSFWMWIIIGLALLTAFLIWKFLNKKTEFPEAPAPVLGEKFPEPEEEAPKEKEEPDFLSQHTIDAQIPEEDVAALKARSIDNICDTASVSPEHASTALSTIYRNDPGLKWPIAHLVHNIGLSQTLRLFPNVDKFIWDELRDSLANSESGENTNTGIANGEVGLTTLKRLHRSLITYMLTMMSGTQSQSIAPELAQLDTKQITSLLESESVDNAAAIMAAIPVEKVIQASRDIDGARMAKILKALSQTTEFSMDKITAIRNRIAAALGSNSPLSSTLKVSTEKLVVPILSNFSAADEQDHASEILATNPGLLKTWAKSRLYKEHLAIMKPAVIAGQLSDLDLSEQAVLWLLLPSSLRGVISEQLSSKQRSALEEAVEFGESNNVPKGEQMAQARELLDKVFNNVVKGNESSIEDIFDFSKVDSRKGRAA
jgi:hypothetical protein